MARSGGCAPQNGKKSKILVVEGQDNFRNFLTKALREELPNVLIEEAENEIETLQKVASFAPDLILIGIDLGVNDGLELTKMIKDQKPDIRIVILTVFDRPEYRQAAHGNGAYDFIIKGVTPWREIVGLVKSISSPSGKVAAPSNSRLHESP